MRRYSVVIALLLLATFTHAETFTLTWVNTDPTALGTSIWRMSGKKTRPDWVGMVDKGVTTYKDEDAPDDEPVTYFVRSFNHDYYSPFSKGVTVARPNDDTSVQCTMVP